MKRKRHFTVHTICCIHCGNRMRVFCQLEKGCYSQQAVDCLSCKKLAGWVTTSPGYKVERLMSVVIDAVV